MLERFNQKNAAREVYQAGDTQWEQPEPIEPNYRAMPAPRRDCQENADHEYKKTVGVRLIELQPTVNQTAQRRSGSNEKTGKIQRGKQPRVSRHADITIHVVDPEKRGLNGSLPFYYKLALGKRAPHFSFRILYGIDTEICGF
ncbi:hypothetical protein MBHK15_110198 [Marinobacter salarius]|nr:hypothetical protein MBHK15_110198 [Marinobacter salarius]